MALDEAAMDRAREGAVVLRTYRWDPACLSLGRNQPASEARGGRTRPALAPGREVVRRPTGGRSVFHGPELTYALVAPDRWLGGPRAIYRAVHGAIAAGLADLGVALDADPGGGRGVDRIGPPLDPAECFIAPAPGEITAAGRKLVGSAQWRHRGAVLQHGSILFRNEQSRAALDGRPDAGAGAIGLDEVGVVVGGPGGLDPASLGAMLAASLGVGVGEEPRAAAPDAATLERAVALERKYRGDEWTWRR